MNKPKSFLNYNKLKIKTLRGFFWAFFDAIGYQGVQFIVMLILARILEPSEFGLIAMLAIFISLSQSILDSGFASALVQKKNANYLDENSVFYFNLFTGFLIVIILWVAAPAIALFYGETSLIILTKVLSLTIIIDSFGIIQYTLLKKSIDFKKLAVISSISSVIAGIISILMASYNYGVWSLVAYTLFNKLFRLILYWSYNSWRPAFQFSLESLKSMFNYGSNVLFISVLETIFNNLYLIVIGKLFSPTDLGYYSRAKSFQQIPVQNISGIVSRVTFPVFSKIQDDKIRLKKGLKKSISFVALITVPMMVGLHLIAEPLIISLLTNKWLPAVSYLELLCAIGLTYPLNTVNLNILKAIGETKLLFKLELIKKFFIVIAIFLTYSSGIELMIIGQIIVHSISYLWNLYFVGKLINYKISDQIKELIPTFIISVLMGIIIYSCTFLEINNSFYLLIFQLFLGVIFYALLCYVFKVNSFMEGIKIIKSKINFFD